ncbi:hypothetical protein MKW92_001820 [Papaver armeniacum]|nr:hypothetical protein MKW92_001820 [Papaver armeniacum]
MKREYNFGFDPVTKEHKVICLWTQQDNDSNVFCEVLTVGQTIWRRIHEQVPYYDFMDRQSVYSSGCIYWSNVYLEDKEEIPDVDEVLVVFDVGREKFRVISVPSFVSDRPTANVDNGFVLDLLEVDGRVTILRMMSSYVKLCIFDDDHGDSNKNNTNTTTSSSNKNWTEVIITLPFSYSDNTNLYFHTIPGTDQIILETYEISKFVNSHSRKISLILLFIYDWKKKTFRRINIDGIPSSTCYRVFAHDTGLFRSIDPSFLFQHSANVTLFTTFVESLWPVRKQPVPCDAKPRTSN